MNLGKSLKHVTLCGKILCVRYKDSSKSCNPRYLVCFQEDLTGKYMILPTCVDAGCAYGIKELVFLPVALDLTFRRGQYEIDYIKRFK